ncbi:unnamed protein product [Angiostrongylus costaricensis]|uniref:PEHE domain-containing protein n=1 Tax=Angiostrongylus costaricensis TaxID=334426 RepID=A0A0R3PH07_ANGCS|nr:unnamed protein product [Angiostrongylus costaricensis]
MMDKFCTAVGPQDEKTEGRKLSSKDFEAILNEIKKPFKNPAPRGKQIIDPDQARYLYFDITQENASGSQDSTLSKSLVEKSMADTTSCSTPLRESMGPKEAERRARRLEMLRERQLQYQKQELNLGGYHDVFNDTCPEFKRRVASHEDSVMTSDDEAVKATQIDAASGDSNIVRSSQGRVGQGCSTPQNIADHTFGPLRTIDISVVNNRESTSTEGTKKMAGKTSTRVAGSAQLVPPSAHNDSLENVLSKMRVTPKKVSRVVRRGAFTRLENNLEEKDSQKLPTYDFGSAVNSNASAERTSQTNFESHQSAGDAPIVVEKINKTFVIEKTNKAFVIEENPNAGKNPDILDTERDIPNAPQANNTNSADVVFAVPVVPTKTSKGSVKTTLHQREERANNSEKKNTSILETMDLDLRSPGRTLFASFPPNKKRSLATTPVKATSSHNGDAMEITIEMSDISQQPSVESGDDSVVDPVTDPRPTEATPSRVIRPCTTSSNIPVTPVNSAMTSFRRPDTKLSASQRKEIIQRSVERLSQPRSGGHCPRVTERCKSVECLSQPSIGGRCPRVTERCESNDRISPYPSTTGNGAQPVTPFEPIDPYRMFAPHAGRSGTARRVPPIKRRTVLLARSSLFTHDMEAISRTVEDKSGGTKAAVVPVEDEQIATSLIPPERDECNNTALSVANNPEAVGDTNENILLDATRRLSLREASPLKMTSAAEDGFMLNGKAGNCQSEGLLMDSVFSTNTPGHSSLGTAKRMLSESELETDSSSATVEAVFPGHNSNDSANVDIPGVSTEYCKSDNVMILRPRSIGTFHSVKKNRELLRGRTLVGVTEVEVRDKRWLKFKTADFRLAKEREQQLAAHRRFLREKRKEEARERKQCRLLDLQSRHERGMDLDITADSIVTSSDDEDSNHYITEEAV